jgi:hypothetical protein
LVLEGVSAVLQELVQGQRLLGNVQVQLVFQLLWMVEVEDLARTKNATHHTSHFEHIIFSFFVCAVFGPELPDFSWYKIPKRVKYTK